MTQALLKRNTLLYFVIFGIAITTNLIVANGQFHGEDEASQLRVSYNIVQSLVNLDPIMVIKLLSTISHPPLRFILVIPGICLFPDTEFGLRIVATLFSLYMTYQIIKLGQDIGGDFVGFCSGFLIACSGVYTWTSMAFCWGLLVAMLILAIRALRFAVLDLTIPEGIGTYRRVNIYIAAAFLINTGSIAFFAPLTLIYFIHNRNRIGAFIKHSLPFMAFYALYYGYTFLLIPFFGNRGQLEHNISRLSNTLNYTSFLENLKGINAYFFPFLAWVFLCCAVVYLISKEQRTAVLIGPFALAWSFYFTRSTQQYAILVLISVFPFAVKCLFDRSKNRVPALIGVVITGAAFLTWNYAILLRPYSDAAYPDEVLQATYSYAERAHYRIFPFKEAGQDLDDYLDPDERFVHDLGGAFTMFYYTDNPNTYSHHTRYAGQFGKAPYNVHYDPANECFLLDTAFEDIGAVVTMRRLCTSQFATVMTYPDSHVKVYMLHDE